jgi:hypothetical protein
MGTSASIAVVHNDGTVSQTRINYDGYLSGVGRMLVEHYSSPLERVEELIKYGEISSLGMWIDTHSFEEPAKDVTVYYGRDRGESDCEPKIFPSIYQFNEELSKEDYNYLFQDGKWFLMIESDSDFTWEELTEELLTSED